MGLFRRAAPKKSIFWDINEIEVYSSKYEDNRILEFNKPKSVLFSMFKNNDVYKLIDNSLKKNKFFKKFLIKDAKFYKTILLNRDYDLIINCENNNPISKKLFYKKIIKDYKSLAYTSIINHQKFSNNKAVQVFTEKGPIAFLPISNNKTSIVFSKINQERDVNDLEIKKLIFKNNKDYQIKKFKKFEKFPLKFSATRSYYYGNVMEFGDSLHRIHPLAGQGFNMSLRDIKLLSYLIDEKISLGLDIDHTICEEFQKNSQDKNFLFSTGIDFIYEFFNFENKLNTDSFSKSVKFLGKNKIINNFFTKIANDGIVI